MIKQIIFFVMLSACNVWVYGMESKSEALRQSQAEENEMNDTVKKLALALDPLTEAFKKQILQKNTNNTFCNKVRRVLTDKLGILTDEHFDFYKNQTVLFGYSLQDVNTWSKEASKHEKQSKNLQKDFKQRLVLASLAVGGAAFCAGYYYANYSRRH